MSQSIVLEDSLSMEVEWFQESPYSRKSYRHVHEASTVREVAVVCDFSCLVETVINEPRQGIR